MTMPRLSERPRLVCSTWAGMEDWRMECDCSAPVQTARVALAKYGNWSSSAPFFSNLMLWHCWKSERAESA